ncbi:MAG: hypothetical protein R3F43_00520 [bacterium]
MDGTTAGLGAADVGSCGGNGPEVIYELVVDGPGEVCLSTVGSAMDTVLHVRQDVCDDPAAEVDCNDDAVGLQSQLTLAVEGGVSYFIYVDSFAAAGEAYTLTITPGACGAEPPPARWTPTARRARSATLAPAWRRRWPTAPAMPPTRSRRSAGIGAPPRRRRGPQPRSAPAAAAGRPRRSTPSPSTGPGRSASAPRAAPSRHHPARPRGRLPRRRHRGRL